MPKKRYRLIPLSNATKVLRAHSTQIEPPTLLEMRNLFLSRSDSAIGLRSDWEPHLAGMYSMSSLIQDTDQEDYLNSAFYVSRAGHTIWFSRVGPFVWDGTTWGLLSTLYNDGTITTDGSLRDVSGSGTSWLQEVWPGCFIREKGEGNDLYTVEDIVSDTLLHTETAMPVLADAEYEILRVHPRYRAEWPMRMEALGGYLVYGVADMTQPIDEDYLSGPWFSNIGRPNLGVWIPTEPDVDDAIVSFGALSFLHRSGHRHYENVAYTSDLEYSHLCVTGAAGLFFRKDWLIDAYMRTLKDDPAAESPAINVTTGLTDVITRIQGKWAVTDNGRLVEFADSVDDTPVYPPKRGQTGYESIWNAKGGNAWGEPVVDSITTKLLGTHLWGTIVQGSSQYVYGDGGYWSGGAIGGVSHTIYDGMFGPNNFVLVGENDGTQATIVKFAAFGGPYTVVTGYLANDDLRGLTYSDYYQRFVAVGTSGACITSDDDGATWTVRTTGASKTLYRVCYDPNGFVCLAVGGDDDGGVAYASLDGITWVAVTLPSGTGKLVDVYYNEHDGYFYFTSDSYKVYRWRKTVYYDPTMTLLGTIGDYKSDWVTEILWTGSLFVAVGSRIWTSPTGSVWTEILESDEHLLCVARDYNSGRLIAAGNNGIGYNSTDGGATWTKRTIDPNGGTIIGACSGSNNTYSGKMWVCTLDGHVWNSSDTITWTKDTSIDLDSENILAIEDMANAKTGLTQDIVLTTDAGNVYGNHIVLNFYAEDGWEKWTENPGSVADYRRYGVFTRFNAFVGIYNFGGQNVPSLIGAGIDAQIMRTSGNIFDWAGARTAGVNRTWATGSGYTDAQYEKGAHHCFTAIGYGGLNSPIIVHWAGGVNHSPHCLYTSLDYGRTWSSSFYKGWTELVPNGPNFDSGGTLHHDLKLGLKRNSSDTHGADYYFRPICNDGTDFFVAMSRRYGTRPTFFTFDQGFVLGDPNEGDILEAEEYE